MTTLLCEMYLFFLSLGIPLFIFLVPIADTGVGFWRLVEWISFSTGVLVLGMGWWHHSIAPLSLFFLCFHLGLSLFLATGPEKIILSNERSLKMVRIIQIVVTTVLFLKSSSFPAAYLLSSLMTTGLIFFSMIFGHWYLVVPKLSEKPLLKTMQLFWPLLLLKMTSSMWIFYHWPREKMGLAWSQVMESSLFDLFSSFQWILLLMRWFWGYIIVGIMVYFTMRLIKMRSIQSATGILYIMVFFSIVGELISLYLGHAYSLFL
jgi:hypothetical protein